MRVCVCACAYMCAPCLYVYDCLGFNLSEFMVYEKLCFMCVGVCMVVKNWILLRLAYSKVNTT